jgi:hypothetical protein
MDNQPTQSNEEVIDVGSAIGSFFSVLLGLVIIVALLIFTFLSGTWYSQSHIETMKSPIPCNTITQ